MLKFSVVVPAYNEARYLPRLLDSIDEARRNFRGGFDNIEIVVADNKSTDSTAQIALDRGCKVARIDRRCIASVRNGGADLAEAEFLCFVDADMRVHRDTFNSIESSIVSGKVVAGATGIVLERMSLGIALSYGLILPVVWTTKIDTGVVFCRKDDFETIGGYRETLQFGEDVRLLQDLRDLGRRRGQRLTRTTDVKAVSSARKWDEHGDWHFFTIIKEVFRSRVLGASNEMSIERFWYGKQREPNQNIDDKLDQ